MIEQSAPTAPRKADVLGIPVSAGNFTPAHLPAGGGAGPLVSFVNPYACAVDRDDPSYTGLLGGCDWVLCDGIGMVRAARRFANLPVDRQSFDMTSLAPVVFDWAVRDGVPVALVGGRPGVAEAAAATLSQHWPALRVSGTWPGFDHGPGDATRYALANPGGLVVCGMGVVRQERFLLELRRQGWRGTGFTCGGFLDQLGQGLRYYPGWVDRMNLRFAWRLAREPGRLWRRYLVDYREFLRRYLHGGVVR